MQNQRQTTSNTHQFLEVNDGQADTTVRELHNLAERLAQLDKDCPQAVKLLRIIRSASPGIRNLALGTSPLYIRDALITFKFCTMQESSESAFQLTEDGLTILNRLSPLSSDEQQELTRQAEDCLSVA